jgi:2-dehydro-3-deoxyphosphooctonate aldolase (KDO 8-P synthase)
MQKPFLIAGPCTAESYELLQRCAEFLVKFCTEHELDLYLKGSFDKANRTSVHSKRGPGLETALEWFGRVKKEFGVKCLTDFHEAQQAPKLAEVFDGIQIPAFLCRQTDLLDAALKTKCFVNIKKGQFLSPDATEHILSKVVELKKIHGNKNQVAITERGSSFGYRDLIVDMRGLQTMKRLATTADAGVVFDLTHSLQAPNGGSTTNGNRPFAGTLLRAAAATGHVDGYFMEVHPSPKDAWSDKETQLSFKQAESALGQMLAMHELGKKLSQDDDLFAQN